MEKNNDVRSNRFFKLPMAHPISWLMLVVTTLAILMNSIDRLILPTLMPAIMDEFNLDTVDAGWIISHYGFSVHYIVITIALVLTCIPLFFMKETVKVKSGIK